MAGFFQTTSDEIGKLILRIALGGVMLFHGMSKLMNGVAWVKGPLSQFGLPGFMAYGLYLGEVVAPILIILGILTRLGGLVVAFDMFMAVMLIQANKIFTVKQAGGWAIELEFLILIAGLVLFFMGSGKYSVSRGKGFWA